MRTTTTHPFVLGLGIALFSAAAFGSSGTFGSALMEIGWTPATPLEEGLRRTVDWYLAHEPWWRGLLARPGMDGRLGLGPGSGLEPGAEGARP